MKRVRLHIAFWLVYIAQDIILQFSYMQRFLNGITVEQQLLMGVKTSLIILPLKLIVTYFALYILLTSLHSGSNRKIIPAVGMVITTALCVVLFRVAFYYYINPIVYMGREGQPPLFSVINIWLAFLEIGFVAAIAVIIKFVRLQFQNKENERSLIKEKLETELKFLRNQTNPHFLFNTLNNIYALALKKSDDTPEMVMKLSKLLNFMLYESRKQTISVGDEMKILDDYIELERIRYNGRLEISFIREIDNESEQMAPLLLLSFVENAFKHGASENRFESYIHIEMKLQENILNFNIENNKEYCEKQKRNGNIGLANVRRQLELMYTDYDLKVEDEQKRFNVSLMVNLNSHAKI